MSVSKFRNIADMPPLPHVTGPGVERRVRAMWRRMRTLRPRRTMVRGVRKFRTIEEAQAARSAVLTSNR